MGMLAAGVAHEINNPLTYMLLNLWNVQKDLLRLSGDARLESLAESGSHGGSDVDHDKGGIFLDIATIEALVERLGNAINGAEYVRDIVKDIKTFSRVDEDHIVALSLNKVIDTAVAMTHNEVKYRARLVREYGNIPAVKANDGRIAQVFLNLLLNAASAIDEGDTKNNQIRIRTWSENNAVVAEVRDTGKGIPKNHLNRLFDPFFTTKPVGIGTGLGLSICYKIITSYGGSIEVKSKVGSGTSFIVRLPAHPNEDLKETVVRASEDPAEHTPVSGRILLVDDDRGVRRILRRQLELEHDVVTAGSGEEGEKILETDTDFDVILCDLMMANGTGMDLHQWLEKRHPDLAERMVFMTGGTFSTKARQFLKRISNLTLEKPFKEDVLERTVRKLISATKGKD